MKINIIGGKGRMGQMYVSILRKKKHKVLISGRELGEQIENTKKSDLTIISVPINQIKKTIKQIAPYCTAMVDISSVKVHSTKCMFRYCKKGCEIGSLHNLYGEVESIKDRPIVCCLTQRWGDKCEKLASALEDSGAKIIRVPAKFHDYIESPLQNARYIELLTLGALVLNLKKTGLNFTQIYELSPPPTRVLLDLLARQICDEKKDGMFQDIRNYNPYRNKLLKAMQIAKRQAIKDKKLPKKLREFMGDDLNKSKDRAQKLIDKLY